MIPYNKLATLVAVLVASFTCAQKACTLTTEKHPSLNWQTCTSSGACSTVSGSVTVDANWRWTHSTSSATNCFSGNTWDSTFCPDGATCASNCCVDGADYAGTYGVTSSNDALSLKFVTQGPYSTNIGSRLYLMETDTKYKMFNLLGNEFTFDVDVSDIGCGLNGALYFVSMDADGGMSKYSGNQAGAKYGTGYCDSQCPRDVKFINGVVSGTAATTNSRLMSAAGTLLRMMPTQVSATSVHAAPRWTFGRPTRSPRPTQPIRARTMPSTAAVGTTAEVHTPPNATLETATPTDATLTHGAKATRLSTVQVLLSPSTHRRSSLLSRSLSPTVPVTSPTSSAFTCRMARLSPTLRPT